MAMKLYAAHSLSGAQRRVRELERLKARYATLCDDLAAERDRYKAERNLMARLAAKTPQFDNPLVVWDAEKVRDEVLAGKR